MGSKQTFYFAKYLKSVAPASVWNVVTLSVIFFAFPAEIFAAANHAASTTARAAFGAEFLVFLAIMGMFPLGLRLRCCMAEKKGATRQPDLMSVLNSIGSAVIAVDTRGRVVGLNPAAELMLGLPPHNAMDRKIHDCFTLIDTRSALPQPSALDQALRLNQEVLLPEHSTLVTLAGARFQVAGSANPLTDGSGTVLGAVLSLHDISDEYHLRQEIRDSEQRFRDVTDSLNDILIMMDRDLNVQLLNAAALRNYKVDPEDYVGRPCHELFWNCQDLCHDCPSLQVLEDGQTKQALRFLADGRILDRTVYPIYDSAGHISGISVIAKDVTERFYAERKLLETTNQLADIANSISGAVFQYRINSLRNQLDLLYVGLGIIELAGLGPDTDIKNAHTLMQAVCKPDRFRVLRTLSKATRARAAWQEDFRFDTPSGTRWVHGHACPRSRDDGSIVFNGVLIDITRQKETEEKLQHQVYHDGLTGLANAARYRETLERALIRARRHNTFVGVVMLDMDNFKKINDTLGHSAGDELLIQVSQRMQATLRGDDMVARLGGDEFMVLFEDLHTTSNLVSALEKLMQAFSTPFKVENTNLRVSPSIGVTTFPGDNHDSETLIKNADAAMYRAKNDGGGRYCFYTTGMTEHVKAQIELENQLHHAIEHHELQLYYQARVNIHTGTMHGMEALVRWNHPQRGLLTPGHFIPVAESGNLILSLGDWVLYEACRQTRQWQTEGINIGRVSVNVAAGQFHHGHLLQSVKTTLDATGLAPTNLCLEITETSLMDTNPRVLADLEELRTLGVAIAIDDFGTGYSSLLYTKTLPVTTLKLDMGFVKNLPHDPDNAAICKAVIAMAEALGLNLVVEGVETVEQRDYLISIGAHRAQGYLWGRPQPLPDFAALGALQPALAADALTQKP